MASASPIPYCISRLPGHSLPIKVLCTHLLPYIAGHEAIPIPSAPRHLPHTAGPLRQVGRGQGCRLRVVGWVEWRWEKGEGKGRLELQERTEGLRAEEGR